MVYMYVVLLYVNFTRIFRVFKKSRVTTENKKLLFPFSSFSSFFPFLGVLKGATQIEIMNIMDGL